MAKLSTAKLSSSPRKAATTRKAAPRKATRPRKSNRKATAPKASRFTSVDEVAQMLFQTPSCSEDEDEDEDEEGEEEEYIPEHNGEAHSGAVGAFHPESLEEDDIIRAIEFALAYALEKASMADLQPVSGDCDPISVPSCPKTLLSESAKLYDGGIHKAIESRQPQFLVGVQQGPAATQPAAATTSQSQSHLSATLSDKTSEETKVKTRLRPRSSLKLTERASKHYRR